MRFESEASTLLDLDASRVDFFENAHPIDSRTPGSLSATSISEKPRFQCETSLDLVLAASNCGLVDVQWVSLYGFVVFWVVAGRAW
jgi:hypothetical protein